MDEVNDREVSHFPPVLYIDTILSVFQADIFRNDPADWNIDKASDARMVYVPKDTVVEFMRKVSQLRA